MKRSKVHRAPSLPGGSHAPAAERGAPAPTGACPADDAAPPRDRRGRGESDDRAGAGRDEAELWQVGRVPGREGGYLRREGGLPTGAHLGVDPRDRFPVVAGEQRGLGSARRVQGAVSVFGSSGGTPRYCRSNFAIAANAGAATTPPKIEPRGSSTLTRTTRRGCDAGTIPTKEAV